MSSCLPICNNSAMSYVDSSDETFDYLFKIVLIGDAGVGKTCVVQRFKSGTFLEKQHSTIGVDFTMKTLNIDGKKVKVGYISVHRNEHIGPKRRVQSTMVETCRFYACNFMRLCNA